MFSIFLHPDYSSMFDILYIKRFLLRWRHNHTKPHPTPNKSHYVSANTPHYRASTGKQPPSGLGVALTDFYTYDGGMFGWIATTSYGTHWDGSSKPIEDVVPRLPCYYRS